MESKLMSKSAFFCICNATFQTAKSRDEHTRTYLVCEKESRIVALEVERDALAAALKEAFIAGAKWWEALESAAEKADCGTAAWLRRIAETWEPKE